MNFVAVAVRMSAGGPTVSTLRDVVAETDPYVLMFRERTAHELASAVLAQPRALTWLIGAFAAAALLVSTLGLYGLLTHIVS